MKKVLITMMTALMCLVSLAGCSKTGDLNWSTSGFSCGGDIIHVDEYVGNRMDVIIGDNNYKFLMCEDITYCENNIAGVLEENMNEYQKAKYYSAFQGSQYYMHYPSGSGYIEAICYVYDTSISSDIILENMYNYCKNLSLSDSIETVDIGGVMTLKVEGRELKVRDHEIIIPGTIKISANDGSKVFDSIVVIDKKEINKTSTEKYDYYQYGDYLIQLVTGQDLSSYVTFK